MKSKHGNYSQSYFWSESFIKKLNKRLFIILFTLITKLQHIFLSQFSTTDYFSSGPTVWKSKSSKFLRLHCFVSRNRHNRPESAWLPDCHVGQDLGIELYVASMQSLPHVPCIIAVFCSSSIDSCKFQHNLDQTLCCNCWTH